MIAAPTDRLATDALRLLPPETAHRIALIAARRGFVPRIEPPPDCLRSTTFGLAFRAPVGLAAGFDKNAEAVAGLLRAGFGFVEVGTVTPRPQPGNPRPRVFRLAADGALINRLGFNNDGAAAVAARLRAAGRLAGPVGVNIGANRDSEDRVADYVAGVTMFAALADYLVVNVSSPNTPGLRDLQDEAQLGELLARVVDARERHVAAPRRPPILVKIAPDFDEAGIARIGAALRRSGIDGVIATNTTLARPQSLAGGRRFEAGGLSGRPMFERSTVVLARLAAALDGTLPIIGVGGVASGPDAFAKIAAGASLVQLYTGLVYGGMQLVGEIQAHLGEECRRRGVLGIGELVGCEQAAWAARPLPD